MNTPDNIKEKLLLMSLPDLKKLAIQEGKLDAFIAITEKEDFELTAKVLGIEESFQKYISQVKDENGRLNMMSLHLIKEYRLFLMANICFPGEFEN